MRTKILASLILLIIPTVWAGETEIFIDKLRDHYQETLPIKAFSLKYHFLNKQYRDHNYWDYQTPNRIMSQRVVEVDLEKKHFYDNDILYNSGGRLFDRVQFQNDKESFFYEKSATAYGKAIINQGMGNFDRFISFMIMNIDFLAIRPLIEETKIKKNISLHHHKESGTTRLTLKTADNNLVDYEFNNKPLRLISIRNSARQSFHSYDDYQTNKGITFARSVHKFYGEAKEPAYISYNDDFDIIEQVDPAKLKLPEGYGPELLEGDGILVSKKIAKDIYLVTDSSAVVNSLFKVDGDKITLFGASSYPSLATRILALINNQFPNKTITSVYVSHPHGHQIAGLKVYADQGIEILADEYSVAGIKAYPAFADDISKLKFRTIEHGQVVDDAHFYVLDTMHSKKQGFVHFKESGIIFQADFLHIPLDNTIAKVIPNYTKTFIDFIRNQRLKYHRIVGNYRNNNITVEVVNKTYEALM